MHDVAAVRCEKLDVFAGDMNAMDCDQPRPGCAQKVEAREGRHAVAFAALHNFVGSFCEMRFDRQVELTCVGHDLFERGITDGIRRMRRESESQPRLVLECVAHGEPGLQIAVRVGGVGGREIEHHEP